VITRARDLLPALTLALTVQLASPPPPTLPPPAHAQLGRSLDAASAHRHHVWRDTPPVNGDGTINAYIEIPRGERRKFELDMAKNARFVDRVMPPSLGGYPINYGFVPQTVSYDGDPFDALVLGPPIAGGTFVRGRAVRIMHMEDEKGLDSKVVLARLGADGRPLHRLSDADERRIADYFRRYKDHERAAGKFAKVPGWGTSDEGLSYVRMTHAFFLTCRQPEAPCKIQAP
jgi:inorganic pyrophosphatase